MTVQVIIQVALLHPAVERGGLRRPFKYSFRVGHGALRYRESYNRLLAAVHRSTCDGSRSAIGFLTVRITISAASGCSKPATANTGP